MTKKKTNPDLTVTDVTMILLDQYSLSDLEFALGASIEDMQYGLDDFIEKYYTDIVSMIKEDQGEIHWDD